MTYKELKSLILKKGINWQHMDSGGSIAYYVYATDGLDKYEAEIYSANCGIIGINQQEADEDRLDFELNYKSTSNLPQGQKFSPFATGDYKAAMDGVDGVITRSNPEIMYHVLDDGVFTNGGELICGEGFRFRDWVEFAIVDCDGVLTGVPGFILSDYVIRRYPDKNGVCDLRVPYVGNPPRFSYMCLRYHFGDTNSSQSVEAVLNMDLHKKL